MKYVLILISWHNIIFRAMNTEKAFSSDTSLYDWTHSICCHHILISSFCSLFQKDKERGLIFNRKKWWTLINSNSRMITFKSSHAYDTILNKPCNTFDTIFIHANVLYFVSWASKSYLIRIYSRAVSFNILTLPILPIYYLDIITDILFLNMMCRARFFYLHLYKTETIRFQEFCLFFL